MHGEESKGKAKEGEAGEREKEGRVVALSRDVARGNRISRKQPPRQRPKIEGAYGEMRCRPVQPERCWLEPNGRGKRKMKRRAEGGDATVENREAVGTGRDTKEERTGQGGEAARKKDVRPLQF